MDEKQEKQPKKELDIDINIDLDSISRDYSQLKAFEHELEQVERI